MIDTTRLWTCASILQPGNKYKCLFIVWNVLRTVLIFVVIMMQGASKEGSSCIEELWNLYENWAFSACSQKLCVLLYCQKSRSVSSFWSKKTNDLGKLSHCCKRWFQQWQTKNCYGNFNECSSTYQIAPNSTNMLTFFVIEFKILLIGTM